MRKLFCFALLICLASFLFAGCGKTEAPPVELPTTSETPPVIGVYSEDRPITGEDMAVFNEAMESLVGVSYEPTLVSTQAVAGINYRFTCTATPVIPDPEPYRALVFIHKPLEGPARLVNIVTPAAE